MILIEFNIYYNLKKQNKYIITRIREWTCHLRIDLMRNQRIEQGTIIGNFEGRIAWYSVILNLRKRRVQPPFILIHLLVPSIMHPRTPNPSVFFVIPSYSQEHPPLPRCQNENRTIRLGQHLKLFLSGFWQ